MTAPFTVDAGDSRLSLNPGPWGVAITVHRHGMFAGITLAPEDASRLAAALILATAHAASYRSEIVSQAS